MQGATVPQARSRAPRNPCCTASQRLRRATLGNGLTVSRDYNRYTGRLTQGSVQNPQNLAQLQEGYDYDVLGNVMQRSQYWPGAGFTESFDYDKLNRLKTSQVLGQPLQSFSYDAIGNLKSKTGNGDYAYPAQGPGAIRPHAVQSIASLGSFVYDDNGNLSSGAGRSASWTSFDLPLRISKIVDGSSSSFAYGPEHQRSRQSKSDGATIWYAGAQETESKNGQLTLKTYWPHGLGVEIDKPQRRDRTELDPPRPPRQRGRAQRRRRPTERKARLRRLGQTPQPGRRQHRRQHRRPERQQRLHRPRNAGPARSGAHERTRV